MVAEFRMKVVGKVESLWRYPVKSMRGEELQEAFVGFAGVYGDRLYAFRSSAAPKGFPYLTGREQEAMLLYRPTYRHPEHATRPENLAEAEAMGPGLTPVYADLSELMVDVETPAGERLPIDDPGLIDRLREGIRETCIDVASIGSGNDGLPSGLDHFDPNRAASMQGVRSRCGQATLPRECLCRARIRKCF